MAEEITKMSAATMFDSSAHFAGDIGRAPIEHWYQKNGTAVFA